MFSATLDEGQLADVLEDLECPVRQTVRLAFVTAGEHPRFGATVVVQTMDGVTLLSEHPFEDDVDRELDAQHDALRASVARQLGEATST